MSESIDYTSGGSVHTDKIVDKGISILKDQLEVLKTNRLQNKDLDIDF